MGSIKEYQQLCKERQEIISENRSRRMRKPSLPPLEVPPVPIPPMGYEIYRDGEYEYFDREDDLDAVIEHAEEWFGHIGKITARRVPLK
ncbi:MAG: hypothetical protein E3J71_09485 [Candidatus Stahlbacteria bacterium]|nr:MAG: hypothetical protein E3J71_09485 [Candidatus Stahlbacteria bacterium]